MQGAALVPGYAPFCKHLFIPNFVGARLGALRITDQNRGRLQCGYSRRRPEELAVLTRHAMHCMSPGIFSTCMQPCSIMGRQVVLCG